MSLGNGYIGSASIETSTSTNHEVLPPKPSDWENGYKCSKFDFINDQDCIVLINNETRIYLRAGQGISIGEKSKPITSFIIEEQDITYNYIAEY